MTGHYELSQMTTFEFAEAMKTIGVALVPVGATEQHGPNLAMGTDYVIAHRFCQRIAEKMHPRAVVTPPISVGVSYHHMGFPGTLTVSAETLISICTDICRSLKAHGIERVVFVNGHNGNSGTLNVAATKIRYELEMQTAVAFWFQQASDVVREAGKTERFGHACEVETSVLMALAGDMVREDQLEAGDLTPVTLEHAFNNQPFFHTVPVPFDQQTRNGVFGDARLADRETGERIVEAAVARTTAFLDTFLKA